jgi:hypothetical protein
VLNVVYTNPKIKSWLGHQKTIELIPVLRAAARHQVGLRTATTLSDERQAVSALLNKNLGRAEHGGAKGT